MNGHLDDATLMGRPTTEIAALRSRSIMIGGIGLLAALAGFFIASEVFWQSYLIAYLFWLSISLGSLGVLMVQYLSGGAWGLVSRRVLEASTRTLPLMAVLFIPIWFELPHIYHWAEPEALQDPLIQTKAGYLNVPFFTARAVAYFAIWIGLASILNKWSAEQDQSATKLPGREDRRMRVVSGPGLVLFVATVTFMSVDWIMSLEPHWYSTIFGILTIGGQGLATMAFTILVLTALVRTEPLSRVAHAERFHDLGKLMFAFVMLWAYFSVSQLLIIWSANLPEEIPFYIERLQPPWFYLSVALLVGQFALPFFLLLSRERKRRAVRAARVALFILVMRVVDLIWMVGPVFRHEGAGIHWLDFAMVVGMGGLWLPLFWHHLAGRAILPARDPYFKEAVLHGGH